MSKRVGKLVNTLKINDAEKCDIYEMFWGVHARKLEHAMDELISLGEEAVSILTGLCEVDPQVTKWSTVYALRVLIQIGGPKATRALLELYQRTPARLFERIRYSMEREKSSRLDADTITKYLYETETEESKKGAWEFLEYATRGGLRDEQLFSLLLEGLNSEDDDIVDTSVRALEVYGDKRAVSSLSLLLEKIPHPDEDYDGFLDMSGGILDALVRCASLSEYRKILADNPMIVKSYTAVVKDYVDDTLADIPNAYSRASTSDQDRDRSVDKLGRDLLEYIWAYGEYLGLYDEETKSMLQRILDRL